MGFLDMMSDSRNRRMLGAGLLDFSAGLAGRKQDAVSALLNRREAEKRSNEIQQYREGQMRQMEQSMQRQQAADQVAASEQAAMREWVSSLPPEQQAQVAANPEAAYKQMMKQQYATTSDLTNFRAGQADPSFRAYQEKMTRMKHPGTDGSGLGKTATERYMNEYQQLSVKEQQEGLSPQEQMRKGMLSRQLMSVKTSMDPGTGQMTSTVPEPLPRYTPGQPIQPRPGQVPGEDLSQPATPLTRGPLPMEGTGIQPGGTTTAATSGQRGEVKAEQAQMHNVLGTLSGMREYLEGGSPVGEEAKQTSEIAGRVSNWAAEAENFGIPGAGIVREKAGEVAAERSPQEYQANARAVTQKLRSVMAESGKLSDRDQMNLDKAVGLLGPGITPEKAAEALRIVEDIAQKHLISLEEANSAFLEPTDFGDMPVARSPAVQPTERDRKLRDNWKRQILQGSPY